MPFLFGHFTFNLIDAWTSQRTCHQRQPSTPARMHSTFIFDFVFGKILFFFSPFFLCFKTLTAVKRNDEDVSGERWPRRTPKGKVGESEWVSERATGTGSGWEWANSEGIKSEAKWCGKKKIWDHVILKLTFYLFILMMLTTQISAKR